MTAWLRRRLHHLRYHGERGTVLVIVAGVMTALMASGAVAIDMSAGRASQQQAQTAADAAALATEDAIISGNASTATTAGISTGQANMPGSTVSVTTTPGASSTSVQATVSGSASNGLGQLLGSASTRVSATAGSSATTVGGTPAAIYSGDSSCPPAPWLLGSGVNVTASGLTVNGNITANGSVLASAGVINVSGTLTYGCYAGPLLGFVGSVNATSVVNGGSSNVAPLNYAATYPSNSVGTAPNICTNPPAGVTVTRINTTIAIGNSFLAGVPSGIVCDSSALTVIGSISGNYTFIAPSIAIGVSVTSLFTGTSLNPASPSLPTFWAYGSGAFGGVTLAVDSATTGTIYAPNSTITFLVAGATVTGYLEAQDISVLVANVTLIGTGPVTGGTQMAELTQ